jgi:hypothetical protein
MPFDDPFLAVPRQHRIDVKFYAGRFASDESAVCLAHFVAQAIWNEGIDPCLSDDFLRIPVLEDINAALIDQGHLSLDVKHEDDDAGDIEVALCHVALSFHLRLARLLYGIEPAALQCYLDGGVQFPLGERLDEEPIGLGLAHALQARILGGCSHIDHG